MINESKYSKLFNLYSNIFSNYYYKPIHTNNNPFNPDTITYIKYNAVIFNFKRDYSKPINNNTNLRYIKLFNQLLKKSKIEKINNSNRNNIKKERFIIAEVDLKQAIVYAIKIFAPDIYNQWKQDDSFYESDKTVRYIGLMKLLKQIIPNENEYSEFIHKLNTIQKMLTMLYIYSKYPVYELLEIKKDGAVFLTLYEYTQNKNQFINFELFKTLNKEFYITTNNFNQNLYTQYIRYDNSSFFELLNEQVLIVKGKHKYIGQLFKDYITQYIDKQRLIQELTKLEHILNNEYQFLELYKEEIFYCLGSLEDNKLYDIETDKYITWQQFLNKPRIYFSEYPIYKLYEKFILPFNN